MLASNALLVEEKFASLFEQLATCGIKQPHHISILMREVFEKARVGLSQEICPCGLPNILYEKCVVPQTALALEGFLLVL